MKWLNKFDQDEFFFISPDVKRGIGLEDILPNYHIICTYSDPLIPILRHQGANIFCLNERIESVVSFNNSGKLLEHPLVFDYIKKNSKSTPYIYITVFKPSLKTDLICRRMGYKLLVNSRELNDKFEDKINFWQLTRKYFSEYSIPAVTGILGKLNLTGLKNQLGLPLVIQFSHGWAGKTTFFIQNEAEFKSLTQKYPFTNVKVTKYIEGFTVLNNACIYKDQILISPPAIQISNIEKLQEGRAVTCGRQWPVKFISEKEIGIIETITSKVGLLMKETGFKGYFGLDFLVGKGNEIYLSEDNARFTASAPFYTKLELGLGYIPLFAYHLFSFLEKDMDAYYEVDKGFSGTQLIFRNPKVQPKLSADTNYGIFQVKDDKYKLLQTKNYFPQKLKGNEFILMRRTQKGHEREDLELSRIESRQEVLATTSKLHSWVENLI